MVLPTPPPKLKLVVRHLPPTLPESLFWKTVEPWCGPLDSSQPGQAEGSGVAVDQKKVLWRKWVQGRVVDENNLHQVFSRAYVLMTNADDALAFHKGFDGHAFRSKDSQEFHTLIELAPSQKVPPAIQSALSALLKGESATDRKGKGKSKVRVDARQGTIDSDPDYLSFLEALSQPLTKPKPEDFIPAAAPPTNSTPLLDHLREQRITKRAIKDKIAAEKRLTGTSSGSTFVRDEKAKRAVGEEKGKGRGKRGGAGGGGGGGGGAGAGAGTGNGTGRQPPTSPKGRSTPISTQAQQQKPIAILKRDGPIPGKGGNGGSVPPPNPNSVGRQHQQPHRQPPTQPRQLQNQQRPPNPNMNVRPSQQRQERPPRPPPGDGGRQGFQPGAALLSAAISASTGTTIGKGEDGKKRRVRTKKGKGEGQNVGDAGGVAGQGGGTKANVDPKEARIDA